MAEEQQQAAEQGNGQPGQPGQTTTAQGNGQPTGAEPGEKTEGGKTFTQAEVDAIVKERIERERRKSDEAAKKAAADAEARTLAEQGKYKELYETAQQRLDELTPFKDRYEALASAQRAALMAEVEKWPAEVRSLLPGEEAEVGALNDAVIKARPLVAALQARGEAAPGQGQPPKPAGQGGKQAEADRRAFERMVRGL